MTGLNLDMNRVRKLVDEGYISVREHPDAPLRIYNYTPKCQFDWHWTPETIACRGLILDEQDKVVARPFPKFFTPDQYKDLRNKVHNLYGLRYKELYKGSFSVSEKMDGSLGILYYHPNCGWSVATRGSFTSDQAWHATKVLREKYSMGTPGYTYLFEIIYPENRIVVDYGKRDELVLLTVLDNKTGEDAPEYVERWQREGYPVAKDFEFTTWDDVLAHQGKDEGYVVKFDNGLRVKVKFAEYLRLHRILTNVSTRGIWQRLSNGESLDDMLDLVPDEFYNWVKDTETSLWVQYHEIVTHVEDVLYRETIKRNPPLTRKELAIKYQNYDYKGIMFQMLDHKSYADSTWRIIKPPADKPFSDQEYIK